MTESTIVSISDLEARLVYLIHRELGYQVGEIFTPSITLKSDTDRHTFNNLVERNLFIQTGNVVPNANPARFMLTNAALTAYDAWASTPAPVRAHGVRPASMHPDPLTDYRATLIEIMHIIDDHDRKGNADSILTEIYQLCEHIIDLHEATQE